VRTAALDRGVHGRKGTAEVRLGSRVPRTHESLSGFLPLSGQTSPAQNRPMVNAKDSFRIPRETRFLKKAGFPAFPAKTFSIFKDYIDALPHITGCTGCNKVLENEKTSGNRYKKSTLPTPWFPDLGPTPYRKGSRYSLRAARNLLSNSTLSP
jgi:hypothetical protein